MVYNFISNMTSTMRLALSNQQHFCAFCKLSSKNSNLCTSCYELLRRNASYCICCGRSLSNATLCGQCLKKPPHYQTLIAGCDYQFPINKAISRIKFEGQIDLLKSLSICLIDNIKQSSVPLPDAIIPIPLHPARVSSRGFNQSLFIANQLAKAFNINVLSDCLIRVKNTPQQIGLTAQQRRNNLKSAFKVIRPIPTRIAIVDDVVTTTATISEASRTCHTHGCQHVSIWCLAKT